MAPARLVKALPDSAKCSTKEPKTLPRLGPPDFASARNRWICSSRDKDEWHEGAHRGQLGSNGVDFAFIEYSTITTLGLGQAAAGVLSRQAESGKAYPWPDPGFFFLWWKTFAGESSIGGISFDYYQYLRFIALTVYFH